MPHIPPPATPPQTWPTTMQALVRQRRTLMLQGPIGWFFQRLAEVLIRHGQTVSKVHFNGGDEWFWRLPGAVRYRGSSDAFEAWLRARLAADRIDAVVLFGQMRPLHEVARRVAREMGVMVYVLEEGYLRPNYVTLERRGVNALSRLPRAASFYAQQAGESPATPAPAHQNIWRTAALAMTYYLASNLMRPVYGPAHHHRTLNSVTEGLRWARGGLRRIRYAVAERSMQDWLCSASMSHRWFLVPLQVQGDSQIRHHSRFPGMETFITEVVESFAAHGAADIHLVIKHHPMDRAYTDHRQHIRRESRRLGVVGRVHYLHDQHLPTLLDHTRGVVTVNSTVGLQALHHGAPVVTLGDSVYGIPGLVYPGPLAQFWADPGRVDAALFAQFRRHLITHTQLNASFYADMPALASVLALPSATTLPESVPSPTPAPVLHPGQRPVSPA